MPAQLLERLLLACFHVPLRGSKAGRSVPLLSGTTKPSDHRRYRLTLLTSTARRKSKVKSQKSKVLRNRLFRVFKWLLYLRRVVLGKLSGSNQLKIKNVKLKIALLGGLYPPLIVDH